MTAQTLQRFTVKELARYNGKEGRPAYTAFEGKVYDVTGSGLWAKGTHEQAHAAGEDLSRALVNAPHDESVLNRYPVVGELVPQEFRGQFIEAVRSLHLHPMVVHFSEVCPMLAAFFVFLYLFFGHYRTFEVFSAYLIVLGFISAIGCMVTGFFSWATTYERTLTRIFTRKIFFSALLFVMMITLFIMRNTDVDILTRSQPGGIAYALLVFALVPVTVLLGHYGGKIVYG